MAGCAHGIPGIELPVHEGILPEPLAGFPDSDAGRHLPGLDGLLDTPHRVGKAGTSVSGTSRTVAERRNHVRRGRGRFHALEHRLSPFHLDKRVGTVQGFHPKQTGLRVIAG